MLKRIFCTLLLVLVSFSFSVNVSATNRYQWITSTDSATISYDTKSIRYYSTNGKVIDVWLSWEYTEDGARKLIENNRAKGLCEEEKWNNFSHNLDHWLLSKDSYKFLESVYYDVNGYVIYSTPYNQYAESNHFVPGSIGEEIRDKFKSFLDS